MWHFPHVRYCWLSLACLLLLALSARAAPPDPVEELRQALPMPLNETANPTDEIKEYRKNTLTKLVGRLRTLSELRRALGLSEWKEAVPRHEDLIKIDAELRKEIADRFVKEVERVAKQEDPVARLALANMIAEMGPNMAALDKNDLGGFAREKLAPVLVQLARDARADSPRRSVAVRQEALRALGTINADPKVAIPVLKEALSDADVGPRRVAADSLVQMIKVADYLRKPGRKETSVEASLADVVAVASEALAAVRASLTDPDPEVRILSLDVASEAARALGDTIRKPFSREDYPPPGRKPTPAELKKIKADYETVVDDFTKLTRLIEELRKQAPAILSLVDKVQCDLVEAARNDQHRLGNRVFEAGRAKSAAVEALENMAHARFQMRRRIESVPYKGEDAKTIDDFDVLKDVLADKTNLAIVTRMLNDGNPDVRRLTVAFVEMLEEKAIPILPAVIEHLNDPDRFVRTAVARSMRNMAPAESAAAVEGLGPLIEDPDLSVRKEAANTLTEFGRIPALAPHLKSAVPHLARGVLGTNTDVRLAVIEALATFGVEIARPAVPALAEALNLEISLDPKVREAAAKALASFGPRALLDPETGKVDTRVYQQVVAALRRAIGDEDASVRAAASDALLNLLAEPPKK